MKQDGLCVCVRARLCARARLRACVCARAFACVRACVCACVRAFAEELKELAASSMDARKAVARNLRVERSRPLPRPSSRAAGADHGLPQSMAQVTCFRLWLRSRLRADASRLAQTRLLLLDASTQTRPCARQRSSARMTSARAHIGGRWTGTWRSGRRRWAPASTARCGRRNPGARRASKRSASYGGAESPVQPRAGSSLHRLA